MSALVDKMYWPRYFRRPAGDFRAGRLAQTDGGLVSRIISAGNGWVILEREPLVLYSIDEVKLGFKYRRGVGWFAA